MALNTTELKAVPPCTITGIMTMNTPARIMPAPACWVRRYLVPRKNILSATVNGITALLSSAWKLPVVCTPPNNTNSPLSASSKPITKNFIFGKRVISTVMESCGVWGTTNKANGAGDRTCTCIKRQVSRLYVSNHSNHAAHVAQWRKSTYRVLVFVEHDGEKDGQIDESSQLVQEILRRTEE
jgi:hypothetical protein